MLEKLSGGGGEEDLSAVAPAPGDNAASAASAASVASVAAADNRSGEEEWKEPYDLENSEAVASAVVAFSAVGDACAADPGRKVAPPPDPAVAAADPDDEDETVGVVQVELG